ncbi:aldose 1-epimerase [Stratiformator vulcanicus]|uniref:Aldose 1-epimerase n=1 Tax=Stratiformator vulcanicus TaxID=2527980 RepID=A0A517R751_9PLAN|nr:aldose 1-epimerase [Stratiformator vulcanicus]QDT39705.1 Aldose 1-epimerase [Stratiformator vulcanicus]
MPHVKLTDADSGSSAIIAADLGFNCFEFVANLGGTEVDVLARQPEFPDEGGKPSWSGIPILFPFPNRIAAGKFTWEGTDYSLPKELVGYAGDNAIHGFCLDRPWRVTRQTASAVTGEFQLSVDDAERLPLWPADFKIELTYEVLGPALRADIKISNPDSKSLPFGFGTHPYFKLPLSPGSDAAKCIVDAPASTRYLLEDGIPTGEIVPAEGEFDLQGGAEFGSLKLDDVYGGLSYEEQGFVCSVMDPAAGLQVTQTCDASFRELVAFTPFWHSAVCLEPYTCPTDAMNIGDRGLDSGLRVLEPDEEFHTWFEIRVGPVVA